MISKRGMTRLETVGKLAFVANENWSLRLCSVGRVQSVASTLHLVQIAVDVVGDLHDGHWRQRAGGRVPTVSLWAHRE